MASGQPSEAETSLKPDGREGQQLGQYRVLKRLGAGGMGHVYLALDTHLGRHVALKFLPPELVSDAEMLLRLEAEARATSSLNHPNILTIYEISRLGGQDVCIVSEHVDGTTLRHAIILNLVTVEGAIDIACQVASALVAAHAAGVVHRDLKPGNIMIRQDGYVKVIDFGLAKQARSGRTESSKTLTRPGSVVGTLHYMSPEQAKGDPVDHRTDLWSLGVVLYEMIANRLPFEGPTDSHVIVSILDHPVPPPSSAEPLPSGLLPIIHRALAKNPGKRYNSAAEMLDDLHALSPAPKRASSVRRLSGRPTLIGNSLPWVAAALIAAAAIGGFFFWQYRSPVWFQIASMRELTDSGRASLPVISPDGRYLAYVNGDPGNQEALIVRDVDNPVEQVKIPPRKILYQGLTFSPDGETLFEVEKDDKLVGRLYAMPILGSRPSVPVLVDIDGPVSFSPDGRRFCFVRRSSSPKMSFLEVADRDGRNRRPILSSKTFTIFSFSDWSPKGDRIAIFINDSPGSSGGINLDLVNLDDRQRTIPLPEWRVVGQPRWTRDGRGILVTSATSSQAANQAQLRELDVRTGKTRDLTRDLANYKSASLTANNSEMVALKTESRASLWVSDPDDFTTGQNSVAEGEEHATLTWADDRGVITASKRSGYPNLWIFDPVNQSRLPLTSEPFVEQDAATVPGGHSVVFTSNRSGQFHLWTFNPDRNEFRQITFGPNFDEAPSVSRDGQWVLYTSWTGNQPHLYRVSISGQGNARLTDFEAKNGSLSPDGTHVLCNMADPATSKRSFAVLAVDNPRDFRLIPNLEFPAIWSPDGKSLTVAKTRAGVSNVWIVPLNGGPARCLTKFDDKVIKALAWSPDGKQLACIRVTHANDVVLFRRQE